MSKRSIFIVALAVVGLAGAAWQTGKRVAAERPGPVAVTVDWNQVLRVSAASGLSPARVLGRFKPYISHVALVEQTMQDLRDEGLLQVLSGAMVPHTFVPAGYVVVNLATSSAAAQFEGALKAKGISVTPTSNTGNRLAPVVPLGRSFLVPEYICQSSQLGVGYDAQAAALVRQSNLDLIARPRPGLVSTPAAVKGALDLAHATGAGIIVFVGNEVLGNPLDIAATKSALDSLGLKFGWIELSPQLGAGRLGYLLGGRVLRTHSISEEEMHNMSPGHAIARYVRGVKERDIRVLYVRLLPTAMKGMGLLDSDVALLKGLKERLTATGHTIGDPPLPLDITTTAAGRAAAGLGLAALLLWVAGSLGWAWASSFGWMVLVAAVAAAMGAVGRVPLDLLSFVGIVLAGSAGLLLIKPPDRPLPSPVGLAVATLVGITALSLFGATLSSSLLADRLHMSGVSLFRGVKLSLMLPPLLVLIVQVGRGARSYFDWRTEGGAGAEWPSLVAGLRESLEAVLRYWHVALILFVMLAAAVMVMRSGNQPAVAESGVEMHARAALESTFGIRPRTKEFLIGDPLLLLGLWLVFRGRRRGSWLALIAGSVGQASVANSFCHLHHPYLVTVARVGIGLGLGAVLGLILIAVWSCGEALLRRRRA